MGGTEAGPERVVCRGRGRGRGKGGGGEGERGREGEREGEGEGERWLFASLVNSSIDL